MASDSSMLSLIGSRISSAFFFSLVVSWLAWNYRMVFVLFSGLPIRDRFAYIDNELYSSTSTILGVGLFFPLLTAATYVLVGPMIDRWVEIWRLRVQRNMREDKLRSEGLELLTREGSEAIRSEIRNCNNAIVQLQAQNRELCANNRLLKLTLSFERTSDTINDDIKALLLACDFGSEVDSVGGTQGRVEFQEDGAAHGACYTLGYVSRWKIDSTRLMLGLADDEQSWTEFNFEPSSGRFVGPMTTMNRNLVLLPLVKTRGLFTR